MDGFHLVERSDVESQEAFSQDAFNWESLNEKEVLLDHSAQPLNMFKYACLKKNIDSVSYTHLTLPTSG